MILHLSQNSGQLYRELLFCVYICKCDLCHGGTSGAVADAERPNYLEGDFCSFSVLLFWDNVGVFCTILSLSLTHTYTHTLTHSFHPSLFTHSLFTHSFTHYHSHSLTNHSLTLHPHSLSLTLHSLSLTVTLTHCHTHTHTLSLGNHVPMISGEQVFEEAHKQRSGVPLFFFHSSFSWNTGN